MDVSQRTRTHRDHRPGRISPDLEAPLRGARIRRRDAAKQVMPRPVRARALEPRGERCPQPAPIADAGDCSPLRRTQPPPSHRRALGTYCERRQRAARQHRDDGVRTRPLDPHVERRHLLAPRNALLKQECRRTHFCASRAAFAPALQRTTALAMHAGGRRPAQPRCPLRELPRHTRATLPPTLPTRPLAVALRERRLTVCEEHACPGGGAATRRHTPCTERGASRFGSDADDEREVRGREGSEQGAARPPAPQVRQRSATCVVLPSRPRRARAHATARHRRAAAAACRRPRPTACATATSLRSAAW